MKEERRRSVRAVKPLFAGYSLACGRTRAWHRGLIRDISDRGLCIVATVRFEVRKKMLVRLVIPSRPSRKLLLECTVVKNGPEKKGFHLLRVRFKRMNSRTRALLREYIAWILVNERGAQ